MKHKLALAAAGLLSCATHAHDGHGLTGIHWHPSDFAGFGFIAIVAGFVLWISRGE